MGTPAVYPQHPAFTDRAAPARTLLTGEPTTAWSKLHSQWRVATQVLTPYEEAQCHVEAWPQYPDALMISNMIAGELLLRLQHLLQAAMSLAGSCKGSIALGSSPCSGTFERRTSSSRCTWQDRCSDRVLQHVCARVQRSCTTAPQTQSCCSSTGTPLRCRCRRCCS